MSEGRTVVVTGASKGIGFQTARRFAKRKDVKNLIVVARDSPTFDDALLRLDAERAPSAKITPYCLDLGRRDDLLATIRRIFAAHGNVHALINNAGYTSPVPIHQVEFDDFERTIAVNLYAPFIFVQELLHLGNQFELIVNVASTAGINGRSGWLTYSASKAAVINMSEVMREELAIYGTRVVCISPGRCATDLRRSLAPDEDPSTIMQPQDVAEVIEMLSSGLGRFVDSANIVVRQ